MEIQHTVEHENTHTIGRLLLDSGKLKPADADKIIHAQKLYNLRFGDAAVKLGLISEEDILQVVSQQFDYACLTVSDDAVDQSIITAFQTYGPEVEAFRALRSQLTLRWFADNKALVITAPQTGVGVSYISANLAVMFAQQGQNTLLIDADMRSPSQNNYFKLEGRLGLSDVLAKRAGLDVIQNVRGLENLSVLASGTIPPNPLELIGHEKFAKLKAQLVQIYEIIIIDSPAMLEFSDAQALTSVTKAALVVAQRNNTELAEIESLKKQIAIAGAEPLGVVINTRK